MNGETYTQEQRLIDLETRVTALESREAHATKTSFSIGEGAEIDLVVLAHQVAQRMRREPADVVHEVTDRLRAHRCDGSARESQFELTDSTQPLVE